MGLFSKVEKITPEEALAALKRGELRLVDVREHHEVALGAAPGAWHIPLGDLTGRLGDLKGERVAFVCASGSRSALATRKAVRAGVDAVNVQGGMMAWSRAGLPVKQMKRGAA